jgi:hypothetical protein
VRRTLGLPADPAGSAFQKAELTASDGASGDTFGISVAISGSTAVVGAPAKNTHTGTAYVFVHSGTAWTQQAELTAADGASGDSFGTSVAISGSTAVIGANGHNPAGAAYVFTRTGTAWSQQAELTAADGASGDGFGLSVAISGSTAVVGASGHNSTGAAYVFARAGTVWSQQAELTASDGAPGDNFGISVAISGFRAVVGAPAKNSGTGAAYVFTRSGSAWTRQAELTASDAAPGDDFGISVAISGSTALVGANDHNSGTGAAYVFTRSGSAWSQQAELTASDGTSGDGFGLSVAISGSTVLVGASNRNSTGAVYAFGRSGTTWSQQAEQTASDGASNDSFGLSVAISGSTAVVGAPFHNSGAGAGYVFALPSQKAELTPSDGATGDQFGNPVAISGSTAIVGAFAKNSFAGAAYVFTRSGSAWTEQAELTASDGASDDQFGTSVAISGSTVVVGAIGHNSFDGTVYVFTRSGTTWTQQAELTDAVPDDQMGTSVAINGDTIVTGADAENTFTGAAYVFTRSGTTWTQQAKLTAPDAAQNDVFGASVAITASTVLVGAYGHNTIGAVYVFTRSGTAWTQQAELTDGDSGTFDDFGTTVAMSGSTAVVGALQKNSFTGAAYVFTRSRGVWSQPTELTAADGVSGGVFGQSVAVSGSTVLVGADGHNSNAGAIYVFGRSGTAWTQQAELTASDAAANDRFGSFVAVSNSTAVVGVGANPNAAAAYVFANV